MPDRTKTPGANPDAAAANPNPAAATAELPGAFADLPLDAPSDAATVEAVRAGTVEVTLSNPWKDHPAGATIRVPRNTAQTLISAGYTTVNPADWRAVRDALRVTS